MNEMTDIASQDTWTKRPVRIMTISDHLQFYNGPPLVFSCDHKITQLCHQKLNSLMLLILRYFMYWK